MQTFGILKKKSKKVFENKLSEEAYKWKKIRHWKLMRIEAVSQNSWAIKKQKKLLKYLCVNFEKLLIINLKFLLILLN